MATALITGINGFTGKYLKQLLISNHYDVYGIGQTPDPSADNYFAINLLDEASVKSVLTKVKPDVIFHLAGISFVEHHNYNDFYLTHIIGTRNLLQAVYNVVPSIKSILVSSSANVYGNQTEGILDETSVLNPANDYAVSKSAMEMMVNLWTNKLPVFITRPFNYTGVGQAETFLIPKIVSHFKSEKHSIELGNIDVWREFNDVRDIVSIYLKLTELCPVGEIVNVCSGSVYSLREVIELSEQLTNKKMSINVNKAFVRANEVKKLYGSPDKLKKLLPSHNTISFQETLSWMLKA